MDTYQNIVLREKRIYTEKFHIELIHLYAVIEQIAFVYAGKKTLGQWLCGQMEQGRRLEHRNFIDVFDILYLDKGLSIPL